MTNRLRSDTEQLFRRARTGDAPALGQLLEKYRRYPALLARLQIDRWLQSKVDAADLVQETFLEAHRDFPQFQGATEAEWVSWLRQLREQPRKRPITNSLRPECKDWLSLRQPAS